MKSYPKFQDVLDGIGEKSTAAFVLGVKRTKTDLRTYRETFPQWVADASERGLANWIHDRLWSHLAGFAEDIPDMETIEKGVLREMIVGVNYRFRVKRHSDIGSVASYRTEQFREFVAQPDQQLPGMEETRLILGYEWIKDAREIGPAVLSLRDGEDNLIWNEPLPDVADTDEGGTTPIITPQRPAPTVPVVEVPGAIGQETQEETDGA